MLTVDKYGWVWAAPLTALTIAYIVFAVVKARDVRASWQKNLRSSLGNSLVPASAPRFRAGRSHDAHVGHVMRNRTAA